MKPNLITQNIWNYRLEQIIDKDKLEESIGLRVYKNLEYEFSIHKRRHQPPNNCKNMKFHQNK